MEKIVLEAAAKLNLALDITGVREDGYHLLDSVFQSISLFDKVAITKKEYGISLSVDLKTIPTTPENTAYKAAEVFFEKTKIAGGADIIIEKHIPSKAGMGGGSADAAAVIVGLNELYDTKLSLKEMQDIGVLVGADVPFCIKGGTARVQGIGEIITPVPTPNFLYLVAVMPHGDGISTKEAYAAYDRQGAEARPDIEALIKAYTEENLTDFCKNMYNVLEEVSSLDEIPEIKEKLLRYGADAAMMTGSGAAVFGVFHSLILAMSARGRFAEHYNVNLAEPIPYGIRIIFEK